MSCCFGFLGAELQLTPPFRSHSYYAGRKRALVLTIVIGGNHEASSHMSEL